MKLIIVDDEPKIRKGLFKLLEAQEGFKVTGVFEDVHSALKALYELEADVIITDIKMPEVSGLELIRQIRERNLNIRIIILSGYSNFSYAQKAIELGVTRYLLKPTDPRELLSVLREVERELLPEAPEYEGRQGQAADGENEIGNLLVVKAIQYIEVHYGGKITLKDMARELHLSPNYLCELFKRHTGKNLMEYVTEYRMQKAKFYLNHVEYKVADVAEMVGYKEAKYFSSAFKKAYGITPLEYRNRR
ncbi:response regulator transcription factor [Lacrimispora indolis]|uniref:response regulator transcription factor n=1 Tax=Lacrimispora indolis TaxID=69825 RepID=UPI00045E6F65|nr:response regulator [Lacrimispora indolis]MBE7721240.1 response regulator [Lacrimispora celerecrescens]